MRADSPPKTAVSQTAHAPARALLLATMEHSGRRLKFATLLYRLLYLVAAMLLFPLLVVIADHVLAGGLPRPLIFGAGILWGLVAILATTGMSLRTVLRRLNTLFVARHVERSRGIAHNPLINMVLLQRSPQADYARGGAVRQAASVLERSDPDSPGSAVSLRRPGLLLLAAIGLWLLYTAITPKPILPSLARLFGADRPAPTATRLELLRPRPGEPVYVGEPLVIEFALSGRSVAEVWFELLDPAAHDAPPLLRSALQRRTDSDAAARYPMSLAAHEVAGDLHYRCSAGDAVVEGVIAVQPRPDLLAWQIELIPPAYVEQPVLRTSDPELRVWAGTRATFNAVANTEVRDPIFVLRGETEKRTRMAVGRAQPCRATLSLPLTESGEYWLEFSDPWGRARCDPPTHRIVVRHDRAPRVEITTPGSEETPSGVVDITHTAWLRAVALDDVRLDGLFLVRDTADTVSRTNLLHSETPARGRSIEVGVATSDLSLEVGESALVWFEARDNRVLLDGTPAPQVCKSRELVLIRMPEAVAESVGDETGPADLTDLADSTGTTERTVKRLHVRGGDEGDTGDATDGTGDAGRRRDEPDTTGGKYRRVPDGGIADEPPDDEHEPPGILEPEDVIETDGEDDATGQAAEDDSAVGEQDQAAEQFEEELRHFGKQHGDEARQVNRRIGSRPDDTGSDDSQSGQGQAGEGGEDDSAEDDPQPGSQADPNSHEGDEPQLEDAAELEEQQPQSQPSEPDQAERDQPEQESKLEQESDDAQPARDQPEQPRDDKGSETRREKPEQSDAKPTPSAEDEQESDRPEEKDEGSKPEQADSDADAEQSHAGEEQPGPPDGTRPEHQPAQEPDAEQGEQGRRDTQEQPAPAADEPEAGQGEQVIPMPGRGQAPQVQPPSEPDRPGAAADDEPADSRPRSDLTDTLELLRRGEEISEDDLTELGWPLEKKRAFIRDFERLREAARRAGVLSQLRWWRAHLEPGSGELTPGSGLSEEVSVGVSGGPSVRDGLEQIAPPAEQRIAPELRALLEAYYRSLAEKRAREREPKAPPSP